MLKHDVRSPENALAYLLECSLATVCDMAMKKSRAKGEYSRQIAIAQTNYDWCIIFSCDCKSSRVDGVKNCRGSVEAWAKGFEP